MTLNVTGYKCRPRQQSAWLGQSLLLALKLSSASARLARPRGEGLGASEAKDV